MVAVLPVLAIQIAFAIGLGMVLGVLNVFFRDVGQLFGVVLQFWFWLTPIIYPASILPERLQPLMALNPMASVMTAYQTILVRGAWPDWGSLRSEERSVGKECAMTCSAMWSPDHKKK